MRVAAKKGSHHRAPLDALTSNRWSCQEQLRVPVDVDDIVGTPRCCNSEKEKWLIREKMQVSEFLEIQKARAPKTFGRVSKQTIVP